MAHRIRVDEIVQLSTKALRNNGLAEDEISIIISHLLDSELSGHPSHGFYRLPGIVRTLQGKGSAMSAIALENDRPFAALVNGGGRLGLVVAQRATELAIDKAKANGFSIVGAYNYVGTTGSMAHYTRRVAESDLIGIVICNSEYAVAPTGGRKAILGTNPISISIPTGKEPIVSDLATSAWSYGNLALAMRENRRISEGVVLDKDGNPSTDPKDADDGVQLPMAGHKGYALGLAIEILAGPFVKAKAGREAVPGSDGFTIIVLRPGLFTSTEKFKSDVDALVQEIKTSPLAPGSQEILIPGERSHRTRLQNANAEYLEVAGSVVQEIRSLLNP